MVSIIIPHHKETKDTMRGLLDSLDMQLNITWGVDYEIVIVNDAPDYMIDNFDEWVNIKDHITQYVNPKEGYPGVSRQIGVDRCKGDFVFFCDADDQLFCSLTLYEIIQTIQFDYDVCNFSFIQEARAYDTVKKEFIPTRTYLKEDTHNIWVFAKLIRKSFLQERNIRFSTELKIHEDSYYNNIISLCNPSEKTFEPTVYVWKYNANSLTRVNNHEYSISTLTDFIHAYDAVADWCINRGREYPKDRHAGIVASIYVQTNSAYEGMEKYRIEIEDTLARYINKYRITSYLSSEEGVGMMIANIKAIAPRHPFFPREGVKEFIKRILAEHKERI